MSKAKEIADERFAKGEISAEEHQLIVKSLNESRPLQTAAPPEQSFDRQQKDQTVRKIGKILMNGGFAALGLFGFVLLGGNSLNGMGIFLAILAGGAVLVGAYLSHEE